MADVKSGARWVVAAAAGLSWVLLSICPESATGAGPADTGSTAPTAVVDSALHADIRHLMETMGSANEARQMLEVMLPMLVPVMSTMLEHATGREEEIERLLRRELDAAITREGGLLDALVELYALHFTREDVRDLLAFYGTPLGRKLLVAMPALTAGGIQAGQAWAEREMPGLLERVRAELEASPGGR